MSSGAIDPHEFNATMTTITDAHGYEVKCATCGLGERMCELTYKPREFQEKLSVTCDRFIGLRQWGIDPEPWRPCVTCGWPRAQHQLPSCTGALTIKGEHFSCQLGAPHEGWGHNNKEAQAVWQ